MKKEEVKITDRLKEGDYYAIWQVHEIQDKGVVVSLLNGTHKHLMDWKYVELMHKV